MKYFEFYGLPVSFLLDETDLKKRFLHKSKLFHPDFHTLSPDWKQAETLELSTLNNNAYQTLADFDKRMGYILQELGALKEEGKNEVPNDFLLEMMEFNETLMELEFNHDEGQVSKAKKALDELEQRLLTEVMPMLQGFDPQHINTAELMVIKDFFFKKRYLWRIQENLDRFAPASKEV